MKRVRIVGLGSPFGDDRIGWLAIEEFRKTHWMKRFSGGVTLLALDRPGVGLVAALRGADAVFLVDGIKSGVPPGTLHRLSGCGWAQAESSISSHDLGVAAAVRMAGALGELPGYLVLLGIEIENIPVSAAASQTARQSLPHLVSLLGNELLRLQRSADARYRITPSVRSADGLIARPGFRIACLPDRASPVATRCLPPAQD